MIIARNFYIVKRLMFFIKLKYNAFLAVLSQYRIAAAGQCIEKGAAFEEKGEFGFGNVDFGDIGSNTVILPIFADTKRLWK